MAKELPVIQAPAEFPVMLDEFLNGISQAKTEMKAAFALLAKQEAIAGPKTRGEWSRLFELFSTQPVAMTWPEWVKANSADPVSDNASGGEPGVDPAQPAKSKGGK